MNQRQRAESIVACAKQFGVIEGLRGSTVGRFPCSLEQLAEQGVPQDIDLPFDTDSLRALVQELAQIEVD